jgi:FSR family fosmidomycin resistance protein-like MFS transporter
MAEPLAVSRSRSLFSYCAFHFIDDGFTDSFYILLPFLAAEFQLSYGQIGFLKGVFSGSMSLFQFPMSLLGEKVGEITVVGFGVLGLAGGFVLLSFATSYLTLILTFILAKGVGGGQHGLSSSVLSRVYELSGRRAAMGTYNFAGDLGKVSLPFILTMLINIWGWRHAVFSLALGGVAVGGFLWWMTRSSRRALSAPQPVKIEGEQKGRWGIRNQSGFRFLLAIGILDISVRNALLTFLPFLLLAKEIPLGQVGFALTLLFAGGAVGKFACGVLAEWLGIIPMVMGTEALTALGIFALFFFPSGTVWFLLPFVGIVLNGTSSVLYATVAEISPSASRSRGYGLYYAITLGSGAVAPLIFGLITDLQGLSFGIMSAACLALVTIPLSRKLNIKEQPDS